MGVVRKGMGGDGGESKEKIGECCGDVEGISPEMVGKEGVGLLENNQQLVNLTERLQVPEEEENDEGMEEVEEETGGELTAKKRLTKLCSRAVVELLGGEEVLLMNNNLEEKETMEGSLEGRRTLSWNKAQEKNLKETDYQTKLRWRERRLPSLKQALWELLELVLFSLLLCAGAWWALSHLKNCYLRTQRQSQDCIYPVLRTMRLTSLAFLLNFPKAAGNFNLLYKFI